MHSTNAKPTTGGFTIHEQLGGTLPFHGLTCRNIPSSCDCTWKYRVQLLHQHVQHENRTINAMSSNHHRVRACRDMKKGYTRGVLENDAVHVAVKRQAHKCSRHSNNALLNCTLDCFDSNTLSSQLDCFPLETRL